MSDPAGVTVEETIGSGQQQQQQPTTTPSTDTIWDDVFDAEPTDSTRSTQATPVSTCTGAVTATKDTTGSKTKGTGGTVADHKWLVRQLYGDTDEEQEDGQVGAPSDGEVSDSGGGGGRDVGGQERQVQPAGSGATSTTPITNGTTTARLHGATVNGHTPHHVQNGHGHHYRAPSHALMEPTAGGADPRWWPSSGGQWHLPPPPQQQQQQGADGGHQWSGAWSGVPYGAPGMMPAYRQGMTPWIGDYGAPPPSHLPPSHLPPVAHPAHYWREDQHGAWDRRYEDRRGARDRHKTDREGKERSRSVERDKNRDRRKDDRRRSSRERSSRETDRNSRDMDKGQSRRDREKCYRDSDRTKRDSYDKDRYSQQKSRDYKTDRHGYASKENEKDTERDRSKREKDRRKDYDKSAEVEENGKRGSLEKEHRDYRSSRHGYDNRGRYPERERSREEKKRENDKDSGNEEYEKRESREKERTLCDDSSEKRYKDYTKRSVNCDREKSVGSEKERTKLSRADSEGHQDASTRKNSSDRESSTSGERSGELQDSSSQVDSLKRKGTTKDGTVEKENSHEKDSVKTSSRVNGTKERKVSSSSSSSSSDSDSDSDSDSSSSGSSSSSSSSSDNESTSSQVNKDPESPSKGEEGEECDEDSSAKRIVHSTYDSENEEESISKVNTSENEEESVVHKNDDPVFSEESNQRDEPLHDVDNHTQHKDTTEVVPLEAPGDDCQSTSTKKTELEKGSQPDTSTSDAQENITDQAKIEEETVTEPNPKPEMEPVIEPEPVPLSEELQLENAQPKLPRRQMALKKIKIKLKSRSEIIQQKNETNSDKNSDAKSLTDNTLRLRQRQLLMSTVCRNADKSLEKEPPKPLYHELPDIGTPKSTENMCSVVNTVACSEPEPEGRNDISSIPLPPEASNSKENDVDLEPTSEIASTEVASTETLLQTDCASLPKNTIPVELPKEPVILNDSSEHCESVYNSKLNTDVSPEDDTVQSESHTTESYEVEAPSQDDVELENTTQKLPEEIPESIECPLQVAAEEDAVSTDVNTDVVLDVTREVLPFAHDPSAESVMFFNIEPDSEQMDCEVQTVDNTSSSDPLGVTTSPTVTDTVKETNEITEPQSEHPTSDNDNETHSIPVKKKSLDTPPTNHPRIVIKLPKPKSRKSQEIPVNGEKKRSKSKRSKGASNVEKQETSPHSSESVSESEPRSPREPLDLPMPAFAKYYGYFPKKGGSKQNSPQISEHGSMVSNGKQSPLTMNSPDGSTVRSPSDSDFTSPVTSGRSGKQNGHYPVVGKQTSGDKDSAVNRISSRDPRVAARQRRDAANTIQQEIMRKNRDTSSSPTEVKILELLKASLSPPKPHLPVEDKLRKQSTDKGDTSVVSETQTEQLALKTTEDTPARIEEGHVANHQSIHDTVADPAQDVAVENCQTDPNLPPDMNDTMKPKPRRHTKWSQWKANHSIGELYKGNKEGLTVLPKGVEILQTLPPEPKSQTLHIQIPKTVKPDTSERETLLSATKTKSKPRNPIAKDGSCSQLIQQVTEIMKKLEKQPAPVEEQDTQPPQALENSTASPEENMIPSNDSSRVENSFQMVQESAIELNESTEYTCYRDSAYIENKDRQETPGERGEDMGEVVLNSEQEKNDTSMISDEENEEKEEGELDDDSSTSNTEKHVIIQDVISTQEQDEESAVGEEDMATCEQEDMDNPPQDEVIETATRDTTIDNTNTHDDTTDPILELESFSRADWDSLLKSDDSQSKQTARVAKKKGLLPIAPSSSKGNSRKSVSSSSDGSSSGSSSSTGSSSKGSSNHDKRSQHSKKLERRQNSSANANSSCSSKVHTNSEVQGPTGESSIARSVGSGARSDGANSVARSIGSPRRSGSVRLSGSNNSVSSGSKHSLHEDDEHRGDCHDQASSDVDQYTDSEREIQDKRAIQKAQYQQFFGSDSEDSVHDDDESTVVDTPRKPFYHPILNSTNDSDADSNPSGKRSQLNSSSDVICVSEDQEDNETERPADPKQYIEQSDDAECTLSSPHQRRNSQKGCTEDQSECRYSSLDHNNEGQCDDRSNYSVYSGKSELNETHHSNEDCISLSSEDNYPDDTLPGDKNPIDVEDEMIVISSSEQDPCSRSQDSEYDTRSVDSHIKDTGSAYEYNEYESAAGDVNSETEEPTDNNDKVSEPGYSESEAEEPNSCNNIESEPEERSYENINSEKKSVSESTDEETENHLEMSKDDNEAGVENGLYDSGNENWNLPYESEKEGVEPSFTPDKESGNNISGEEGDFIGDTALNESRVSDDNEMSDEKCTRSENPINTCSMSDVESLPLERLEQKSSGNFVREESSRNEEDENVAVTEGSPNRVESEPIELHNDVSVRSLVSSHDGTVNPENKEMHEKPFAEGESGISEQEKCEKRKCESEDCNSLKDNDFSALQPLRIRESDSNVCPNTETISPQSTTTQRTDTSSCELQGPQPNIHVDKKGASSTQREEKCDMVSRIESSAKLNNCDKLCSLPSCSDRTPSKDVVPPCAALSGRRMPPRDNTPMGTHSNGPPPRLRPPQRLPLTTSFQEGPPGCETEQVQTFQTSLGEFCPKPNPIPSRNSTPRSSCVRTPSEAVTRPLFYLPLGGPPGVEPVVLPATIKVSPGTQCMIIDPSQSRDVGTASTLQHGALQLDSQTAIPNIKNESSPLNGPSTNLARDNPMSQARRRRRKRMRDSSSSESGEFYETRTRSKRSRSSSPANRLHRKQSTYSKSRRKHRSRERYGQKRGHSRHSDTSEDERDKKRRKRRGGSQRQKDKKRSRSSKHRACSFSSTDDSTPSSTDTRRRRHRRRKQEVSSSESSIDELNYGRRKGRRCHHHCRHCIRKHRLSPDTDDFFHRRALAGYCFVEFPSQEAANYAMLRLSGKVVPGSNPAKRFKLNHASYGKEHLLVPEYSLFVGDLSEDVDDLILFQAFSKKFPSCRAAKVVHDNDCRSRGYGFVRFTDESDQQRALNEMQNYLGIGTKAIRVSPATPKRPAPPGSFSGMTMDQPNCWPGYYGYGGMWGGPPGYGGQQGYGYGGYGGYGSQQYGQDQAGTAGHDSNYQGDQGDNLEEDEILEDPMDPIDVDKANREFMEQSEEFYEALESSRWHPLDNVMSSVTAKVH